MRSETRERETEVREQFNLQARIEGNKQLGMVWERHMPESRNCISTSPRPWLAHIPPIHSNPLPGSPPERRQHSGSATTARASGDAPPAHSASDSDSHSELLSLFYPPSITLKARFGLQQIAKGSHFPHTLRKLSQACRLSTNPYRPDQRRLLSSSMLTHCLSLSRSLALLLRRILERWPYS